MALRFRAQATMNMSVHVMSVQCIYGPERLNEQEEGLRCGFGSVEMAEVRCQEEIL